MKIAVSSISGYIVLWVYNLLFTELGVIYVVDELDYEQKKQYELTVRATDSVSGVYAEVLVSILVLDVNDCPPEFSQDSYNISVSEAAPFGTSVLKVSSRDNDTGKVELTYSIIKKFLYSLMYSMIKNMFYRNLMKITKEHGFEVAANLRFLLSILIFFYIFSLHRTYIDPTKERKETISTT